MTQAYHNLGVYNITVSVTNLYVRFLPTTAQLAALDSTMDAQGLELFDTPVDYNVTYEGDYYQDPAVADSLPTWQYAVVPPNFTFPAGITHQTLASIHIPGDDYTAVETEAERLASIQDSLNMTMMSMNGGIHPNVLQCGTGYHWDYELLRCVPNIPEACPPGYHWDGTMCIRDAPPPPPLSPAPDAAIPAGHIYVFDTNLGYQVAVRNTRVVARRWFKIERVFTDQAGYFVFIRRFKHKVRINVKFKNDYAQVRGMLGVRLWQMLFAVKKTLGIYSGDKSNITYTAALAQTFAYFPGVGNIDVTVSNKSTRYWAAATTLNSVQEYRDYATAEQIGLPPTGIRILLSNYGKGSGFTPMYGKRGAADVAVESVEFFVSPLVSALSGVVNIFKDQIDIGGSYNFRGPNDAIGYPYLRSDAMKELFYHELTHAAQYQALGNSWYTAFVGNEAAEVFSNFSSGYAPYGDGTNGNSPQVALGESWAYYIGHIFADEKYNTNADCQSEQIGPSGNGVQFCPGGNNRPHILVEENFDPNLLSDPFKWIPQGLFRDLNDNANEQKATGGFVNDNVSGFTDQQMFDAFQNTIFTLQDYRLRLIQLNPNNQTTQITSLFGDYHY